MTRIAEHAIGGGGTGRSPEAIQTMKEAYRIVIMSDLYTSRALTRLEAGGNTLAELQRFNGVIKRSRGGIGK